MRVSILYLRSRTTLYSIASLFLVALLAWLGAQALLARPWAIPEMSLIPVLLFAPLTAACVVGVSTRNPFGEVEHTSGYPLPLLRLLHLASLIACACLLLLVVANGSSLAEFGVYMVRNALGLSGISLLASWILGSDLSWTLPLSYVAAVQLTGRDMNGDWAFWAWPAHTALEVGSSLVAIALLALGVFGDITKSCGSKIP